MKVDKSIVQDLHLNLLTNINQAPTSLHKNTVNVLLTLKPKRGGQDTVLKSKDLRLAIAKAYDKKA